MEHAPDAEQRGTSVKHGKTAVIDYSGILWFIVPNNQVPHGQECRILEYLP